MNNTDKVIQCLEKWFWYIEMDNFPHCEVDFVHPYLLKLADNFIEKIDDFFEVELELHPDFFAAVGLHSAGKRIDKTPEFSRLNQTHRIAMYKEVKRILIEDGLL